MSEEAIAIPVFIPGDIIRLRIYLEHAMNIEEVAIRFVNPAQRTEMWQGDIEDTAVLAAVDEGEGTLAEFDLIVKADHFPGLYRLHTLSIRTAGGNLQELGVEDLPIWFNVEAEPTERVTVRNWWLDNPPDVE